MPRIAARQQVLTTCDFNVHQLHPSTLLRWMMSQMYHAMENQVTAFQNLVKEEHWSMVVIGFEVTWSRPLSFFDANHLDTGSTFFVHDGKRQILQAQVTFASDGNEVARVHTVLHPVALAEGKAFTATPCGVPDRIKNEFHDDEILTAPPPRFCASQLPRLTALDALGTHRTPFQVTRDDCEFADQWRNSALAGLVGRAREATARSGEDERVRYGLSRALTSMSAELKKPIFFQERGAIDTSAYWDGDHTVFVHRVLGAKRGPSEDSRQTCAVVVEHMAAEDSPWPWL